MIKIQRFIMKLKERFKIWLFKEELNDIKKIKEQYKEVFEQVDYTKKLYEKSFTTIDNSIERLHNAESLHEKSQQLISDCHKFMNSICDVGTDIGFRSDDHSWAVICIHGNMDYVKFVDMGQKDIQSIANFLRNFEYSNRVTDSPLNKRWIEDMILRI